MSLTPVLCHRSRSNSGNVLIRIVALVLVLAAVTYFLTWVFRSDAQRVKERVDAARDALVEGRDEEFLEVFRDDLTYQGGKGIADLRRDLRRWREMSLVKVFIVTNDVEIVDGVASVTLLVAVGQGLLELGQVDVSIEAIPSEDGEWRVRSFSWTNRR